MNPFDQQKTIFSPWYYRMGGILVKRQKPFLPGNYIHIKRWEGCYRVWDANVNHFTIIKNRRLVRLGWEEFRCLKGGGAMKAKHKRAIDLLLDILSEKTKTGNRRWKRG